MSQDRIKREFVNKVTIKLAQFEDERKKRLRKLCTQTIIAILAIFIGLLLSLTIILSPIGFGIIFFAVALGYFNISGTLKDFQELLKLESKTNLLDAFNLRRYRGEGFSEENLRNSNLFPMFTYAGYDDIITGTHNGVEYNLAEVKLVSKQGKKSRPFTVFKGIVVSFPSNKKIIADTLVTTKGDINIRNYDTTIFIILRYMIFAILGFFLICNLANSKFLSEFGIITPILSIWLVFALILFVLNRIQREKMQSVKLEDTEFDKKFNVYTKDQIEARYLLTTAFMDRLKSLETAFGTKGIKCSFFKNQLMIAIPTTKDLFELGSLLSPLSSNKPIEKFYDEIDSIQQMVDHFKLNEKTGL